MGEQQRQRRKGYELVSGSKNEVAIDSQLITVDSRSFDDVYMNQHSVLQRGIVCYTDGSVKYQDPELKSVGKGASSYVIDVDDVQVR